MMRDMSYSGLRVGLYPYVKRIFETQDQQDIGFLRKSLAALITGALGSAIANPTDLIKIRQQAEAGRVVNGVYTTGLYAGKPPTYRNCFVAFVEIPRREGGLSALYKGVTATSVRAALLTMGNLATYDHSKYLFKEHQIMSDGVGLHLCAALISGLSAATFAAPADIVKSRIMADQRGADGLRAYKGPLDCLWKTIRHEGLFALYKGWLPSYLRLGPHFAISMPLLEQIRRLFGLGYM
eukprot:TRINITY_DN5598_c0_g1_i10.p1 TRINITY_DN5598_c0_g1~~TRINITY_DN5598_c0_g1_i10.p1  ORF type:complete len:272 (-),score=42.91 TRINITY_DN5598_c0_g1_i10:23-736(-)